MNRVKFFANKFGKRLFFLIPILILLIGASYAYLSVTLNSNKIHSVVAARLSLSLDESTTEGISLENAEPVTDSIGLKYTPYTFTITNDGNINSDYKVYLDDIDLAEGEVRLTDNYVKYNLVRDGTTIATQLLSETGINPNRILDSGVIKPGESFTYELKLWVDVNAPNDAQNKVFSTQVRVEGLQQTNLVYQKVFNSTNVGENGNLDTSSATEVYVTGTNPNNYVWYSGKLWRAVSKNTTDNTVKLISQWNIATLDYNSVSSWLNDTFLNTLYNYEKFVKTDSDWGSLSTGAVGLLSLDEYNISYKNVSQSNGYLNNGLNWWVQDNNIINSTGSSSSSSSIYGVRPTIVLNADVNIKSGTGTISDPYTLLGDPSAVTNDYINTRHSGEYVKFNDSTYRIISVNDNITKIVSIDSIGDIAFDTNGDNTYVPTSSTNIGYYLNNDWYNSIADNYKNMITTGEWVSGSSTVNSNVGLISYKELMSGQFSSTSSSYWTITPTSSGNYYITNDGKIGEASSTESSGIKPAVYLNSNVYIIDGQGTLYDPYIITQSLDSSSITKYVASFIKVDPVISIGSSSLNCKFISSESDGCSVTLPTITAPKGYKAFWTTDETATTGNSYGDTVKLTSNTTYYAKAVDVTLPTWELNDVTSTSSSNTISNTDTLTIKLDGTDSSGTVYSSLTTDNIIILLDGVEVVPTTKKLSEKKSITDGYRYELTIGGISGYGDISIQILANTLADESGNNSENTIITTEFRADARSEYVAVFTKDETIDTIGSERLSCTVVDGETCNITLPSITALDGYTVDGWYTSDGEKVGAAGDSYSLKENVILTAKATPNQYTVTYDYKSNGGSSATKETDTVNYNEFVDLTPTATKDGYEFVGWSLDSTSSVVINDYKMPSSNITLFAVYRKSVTANFYYYNGTSQDILKDTCTIYNNTSDSKCEFELPTAVSNSYGINNTIFKGVTKEVSSDNIITNYNAYVSTDYYAYYEGTITANYSKGTGVSSISSTMDSCDISSSTDGNSYSSTSCTITLPKIVASTGYTVDGWYKESTKVGSSDDDYVLTTDEYLTAIANINKYNITYDYKTNGGNEENITLELNYNKDIDLTKTATRDGYEFVGWNIDKDATVGITELKVGTTDITLYAIFKKTVTANFYYYKDGAVTSIQDSCTIYNNTADNECKFDLPNEITTTTGIDNSTYVGMSKTPSVIEETDVYDITVSTNYYAYYEGTWTVDYSIGNGIDTIGKTKDSCTSYKVTDGVVYTSTSCEVTLPTITAKTGFTVAGWYYGSDNVGTQNEKYTLLANVGLEARANDIEAPVCKFSDVDSIYIGNSIDMTLDCTDNNSISPIELSVSDFTLSNDNIEITNITSASAIDNGYSYTLTLKGLSAGESIVSLNENVIYDDVSNANVKTDSNTINIKKNSYTLTIDPNGGTYNNSSSNTTVTQLSDTTYGLLIPGKEGYSFDHWDLSGSGTLQTGIIDTNPYGYNGFTRTKKTDTDGTSYSNYSLSTSYTESTWHHIRYTQYPFTVGHTYRISVMIRVNELSNATIQLRHAAYHNDYNCPGRVNTTLSAATDGWKDFTLERTFDGSTVTDTSSEVHTVTPLFEIYSSDLGNVDAVIDFDIKNLVIEDITDSSYVYSTNDIYKFGYGNGTVTASYVDDIAPICVWSNESNMDVFNSTDLTLTCTDTGSGISSQTLNTSDFTSSNENGSVTAVGSPVAVDNGYKYNVTVKGDSVGSFNISLNEGAITDNSGNGNKSTTSSDMEVSGRTYTATFTKQGTGVTAIGSTTASCTTTGSNDTCTVTAPTISVNTGYTAIGWNTDKDATTGVSSSESITLSSNSTYYSISKKDAITYTATFNKNGAGTQTNSEDTAVEDDTVTRSCTIAEVYNNNVQATSCEITSPKLTGSTNTPNVVGYNTTADATTSVLSPNTAVSISSNVTYYAITKSDPITRTATFYLNGAGTQTNEDGDAVTDSYVTRSCQISGTYNGAAQDARCSITVPTITGSTNTPVVVGYNTTADATTSSRTPGSSYSMFSTSLTEFYAITMNGAKTYSVTYGIGSNVDSIGSTQGSCTIASTYNGIAQATSCEVTLPSITPNTGYTSVGWSQTIGATSGSSAGSKLAINSANNGSTYYANAVSDTYTIEYYSDDTLQGSSGVKVDQTYTLSTANSISLDGIWHLGYVDLSTGALTTYSGFPDAHYTDKIYLKGGVTYTLSGYGDYYEQNDSKGTLWRAYNLDDSYIGSMSSTNTYTPEDDCYVRILYYLTSTEEQRNNSVILASDSLSLNKDGYTFKGWSEEISNIVWHEGFVNLGTGALMDQSDVWPDAHYTDMIYLKSGVTYTMSGYGDYQASSTEGILWRGYSLDGTYLGNLATSNTYTPDQDCYVRIVYYYESTETQRNDSIMSTSSVVFSDRERVTNLVTSTGTVVKLNAIWSDETGPVCTWSDLASISYGGSGTLTLSCTDTGSGMSSQTLSTSSFTTSSSSGTITSVSSPTAITNGYKYTVTVNGAAAGTFNVSLNAGSLTDNSGNTNISTASSNVTVNKLNITVSKTDYSGTYDGSSHTFTLTTTPSSNVTIYYSTSTPLTSSNYSTSGKTTKLTRTAATEELTNGKITVYYYVHDTSGNYNDYASDANNNNATITISKRSVTYTAGSSSKVYDGTALTNTTATLTSGSLVSGHTATVTTSGTITNVGTATNTLSSVVINHSNGTDVSSNYNITKVNGTLEVTKAYRTVENINYSGTYDGAAHTIDLSIEPSDDIEIYYSTTTGLTMNNYTSGTTTKPTRTDAGTTTVYYYILDKTGNYNNYSSSWYGTNASITINKKSVTYTAGSTSKVYDGTALTNTKATLTSGSLVSGHTATVTTSGTITNVGTATNTLSSVVIKDSSGTDVSSNYNITKVNGTLTVTKADIAVSVTNYKGTYDGSSHTFTLTTTPSDDVTIYYSTSTALTSSNYSSSGTTTKPTRINAGTSTVYYYVHDTSGNYNDYASNANSNNASIVIWRKSVTIPTAENYCQTLVYNGSSQTLTKTAETGYSFSGNTGTNAGTYTVTATLASNYKWSDETSDSKTFECTISKKPVTLTLSATSGSANVGSSTTFTEKADVAGSFTNKSASTTYATVSPASYSSIAASTAKTVTVTAKSVTSAVNITVTFTPTDTTNYSGTSATYSFAAKAITYSVTFNANGNTIAATSKSCTTTGSNTTCTVTTPVITAPTATPNICGYKKGSSTGTTSCDVGSNATLTLSSSNSGSTYYAQTYSSAITRTATFNKNGATSQTDSSGTVSTATTVTRSCTIASTYNGTSQSSSCTVTTPTIVASSNTPTIVGYATSSSATSASVSHNSSLSLSSSPKYYAITKYSKTYKATFSKGDNVSAIGSTSKSCTITSYNGTAPATSCSITLPTITPATNYIAAGWYNGSTYFGSSGGTANISANISLTAKANKAICKRATSVMTNTCTNTPSSSYYNCAKYGSTGTSYNMGQIGTSGKLSVGDNFICDVDGDGTYSTTDEVFFYLRYSDSTAYFIYSYNTKSGSKSTSSSDTTAYGTSNSVYFPNTAYTWLPKTTQWSAVALTNTEIDSDDLYDQYDVATTYSLANYAARMIKFSELMTPCGFGAVPSDIHSSSCAFLLANTSYYRNGYPKGYWFSSHQPSGSSGSNTYYYIDGSMDYVDGAGATTKAAGVRPLIEVPMNNVSY